MLTETERNRISARREVAEALAASLKARQPSQPPPAGWSPKWDWIDLDGLPVIRIRPSAYISAERAAILRQRIADLLNEHGDGLE